MYEGGDGAMELIHIIIDLLTMGAICISAAITLAIWYEVCELFVFEQGYLKFIDKRKVLKGVLILLTGIVLFSGALYHIHNFLWNEEVKINAGEAQNVPAKESSNIPPSRGN